MDVLEEPNAGNVPSIPSPQTGFFPCLLALLTAFNEASILVRSTNTTTAVLPLRCNSLSHVSGSTLRLRSTAAPPFSPLFLFLLFLLVRFASSEAVSTSSSRGVTMPVPEPSKCTSSILPLGKPNCDERRCLTCASVASIGRFTRNNERGVKGVGSFGSWGLR